MNLLNDVITYVRRIVKTPSNASLSDNLIIDYINRFWLMDVDARMQLFDLKTKYEFQTRPGINHYNMPLYNTNGYPAQGGGASIQAPISYYPVYQGFMDPVYVNGFRTYFSTQRDVFFNNWPLYTQALNNSFFGDGGAGPYTFNTSSSPAIAGYVDITGIITAQSTSDPILITPPNPLIPSKPPVLTPGDPFVAKTSIYPAVFITTQDENNNTIVVNDSGQFLKAPTTGNMQLGMLTGDVNPFWDATTNVVNYTTGEINVTFNVAIPAGMQVNTQSYFVQQGVPRSVLFNNNCLTLMPPPDISYHVELDAYLTPAAFLSTGASLPFAYMAEYIARGAARKILSDTGDAEQFMFYEPLFREQEMLVWKRSQRQFTATRTQTIFSETRMQFPYNNYSGGGI